MTDEDYLTDAMRRQNGHASDGPVGFDRAALVRWTPEVRVLADLVDELRYLRATVTAIAGGKPGEPPRYPRPQTALEVVRFKLAKERHEKLVNRVLPNRAKE